MVQILSSCRQRKKHEPLCGEFHGVVTLCLTADVVNPEPPFAKNFRANESVTSTRSDCRELPPKPLD
jgi:hypothetical protein